MKIAGDLCIYTNHCTTLEILERAQTNDGPKPKLGYWNFRGKGSQIKHLLAYVGVEYDLKEYEVGGAPDYSRETSDWVHDKQNLGLDFPNLPYL